VLITFAVPNISWQGHLGGFVGGVLATGILVYAPRQHRAAYQAAGLTALAAVLAAAIVAGVAQLS
jgi:membrane associated rhomboid family serine protease